MSDPIADLEPRPLWTHFAALARIPRPSKHEGRVAEWIRGLAAEHAWDVSSDATGNLVVRVPASAGRESAPPVMLQSHIDMVCEKNQDSSHDFMNDPIRPRLDGDWVRATGTTLGADNGIGVAAALAAATDPEVLHGPLELLFTVDEETGLTGAQGLDDSLLQARTMLNMDSEEDGKLFVGCAGGADCHLTFEPELQAPAADGRSYRLTVRGLRGGHSGLDIAENRGNAIVLLTRVLLAAREAGVSFGLGGLRGGSMHNAIPREADADVQLAEDAAERFRGIVACNVEGFRTELAGVDDGLEIGFEPGDPVDKVFTEGDADRLLRLLAVLPHGVLGMSRDLEGLVETSSNLAVVARTNGALQITTSSRSSVGPALERVVASIRAAGALAGAAVKSFDGYPGWKPRMDSPVLEVTRGVYREIWGCEPEVTAVHAGLECGLLGEKIPGIDMISFGPEIRGAHSPDERVSVESVARFWRALTGVLANLSAGNR